MLFCLLSFVASALYGASCIISSYFCDVETIYQGVILLSLNQVVLELVLQAGPFGGIRGCTFDIPQAYQAFHRTVEVSRSSNGDVGKFSHSSVDGVVSDIPATKVPAMSALYMMN